MSFVSGVGSGYRSPWSYIDRASEAASAAQVTRSAPQDYADSARYDTVQAPGASRLLAQPLLLPTERNVRALSADLAKKLSTFFRDAGITAESPVEFSINENTGEIRVKSDRPDAKHIEDLLNQDADLRRLVQTLTALSSHAYELPLHLKFQDEYRASDNPQAVVDKYAFLFGPRIRHQFSFRFDGSAVGVLADNRMWLYG